MVCTLLYVSLIHFMCGAVCRAYMVQTHKSSWVYRCCQPEETACMNKTWCKYGCSFFHCMPMPYSDPAQKMPPGRGGFSQNRAGFVEIHASEVDTTFALCDTPTTHHQPATTGCLTTTDFIRTSKTSFLNIIRVPEHDLTQQKHFWQSWFFGLSRVPICTGGRCCANNVGALLHSPHWNYSVRCLFLQ